MRASWVERPNFGAAGRRFAREKKREIAAKLTKVINEATEIIIERTPVYTGKTLVNFQWSVGTPSEATLKPLSTGGRPGKTSTLALGSEPRREANAALVRLNAQYTIQGLKANPFQQIFLVNNSDTYYAVEYGSYSENSRTPAGGITRAAEVRITTILEGLK